MTRTRQCFPVSAADEAVVCAWGTCASLCVCVSVCVFMLARRASVNHGKFSGLGSVGGREVATSEKRGCWRCAWDRGSEEGDRVSHVGAMRGGAWSQPERRCEKGRHTGRLPAPPASWMWAFTILEATGMCGSALFSSRGFVQGPHWAGVSRSEQPEGACR